MDRTCLLVVDIQKSALDYEVHERESFLDAVDRLIRAARATGLPVVHIRHNGAEGTNLEPGTVGWEFPVIVEPADGEQVFAKRYNSAFKDTNLEGWLRQEGFGTLVMCGLQTEYCLDATIKSAFDRGFRIVLPREGHTTWNNGGTEAGWIKTFYADHIWRTRYAAIRPVEELVDEIPSLASANRRSAAQPSVRT